jgi:hypothetical protein
MAEVTLWIGRIWAGDRLGIGILLRDTSANEPPRPLDLTPVGILISAEKPSCEKPLARMADHHVIVIFHDGIGHVV